MIVLVDYIDSSPAMSEHDMLLSDPNSGIQP